MMYLGSIYKFNIEKGYGFICSEHFNYKIFFHLNEIKSEGFIIPKKDMKVSFQIKVLNGKTRAFNVFIT